jgi:hypothetical protein
MNRRARKAVIALVVAALVVGSALAFAHGVRPAHAASATRVFDRTVVCRTTVGYVRVAAGPGANQPYDGGVLDANGDPSSGALRSPGQPGSGGRPLAGVIAKDDGLELYRGAYVDMKNCTRTTNKVPLTGRGLLAPVAFDVSSVCPTGGRVLVRLRYTYVPGVHNRDFQVGGRLVAAFLAIRSYGTLKPVVFAKLSAGGLKLQFSSARSCTTAT